MDSQQRGRLSFQRLRNQRIAARQALSPTLRKSYDRQLSEILYNNLDYHRKINVATLRKIVRLLDKGATASFLDPYELGGPNLGHLVDALDEPSSEVPHHQIFRFLDHIVASPCDSWATNRRYAGNGGCAFPSFLINAIVTGDMWGFVHRDKQNMHFRFRAWVTLRKMVWAYQDDLSAGRLRNPRTGFIARLMSDFLRSVSWMERSYLFSNVELRLFDAVVEFFKPRSDEILSRMQPESYGFYGFGPLGGPLATELIIRMNSQKFEECYKSDVVKHVFNGFFSSKLARKRVLGLLSYPQFRNWLLSEECVRELCRRKERVLFEELYKKDAESLTAVAPFALSVLESSHVRGCKHRLIDFLRAVSLRNVIQ